MTLFIEPPKTIEELKERLELQAEYSGAFTKEEYDWRLAWGIELYDLKEEFDAE